MSILKIHPDHKKKLDALRRIEGQVRGVQKMVEEKRYCVDILTQLSSIAGAVARIQDDILEQHLNGCVTKALKGKSGREKETKVNEVIALLKKFRKNS